MLVEYAKCERVEKSVGIYNGDAASTPPATQRSLVSGNEIRSDLTADPEIFIPDHPRSAEGCPRGYELSGRIRQSVQKGVLTT